MSRFSSKCDLWDWLGSIAHEKFETPYECYLRLHTRLYVGDDDEPVLITKPSDLVPYYPYYDSVHVYEEGKRDDHWMVPPKYVDGRSEWFFKNALYNELKRVEAEEDAAYV